MRLPPRPVLMLPLALLALTAGACGNADSSGAAEPATRGTESRPTLYGRWSIVAINGSPPLRLGGDAPQPSLVFAPGRYEGSSGCNSFGGTGLLAGNRWFGEPPMATQQGCGRLDAQERAVFGIASGGPAISFERSGEAILTTVAGSLRLRRQEGGDVAPPERKPMLLAGSQWEVGMIDGRGAANAGRLLTFEADRWTLSGGCAPLAGEWRQQGQRVTFALAAATPRSCGPEDQALRGLFASAPHYVVGPNRELVIGGGEHWLTGQFARRPGLGDQPLLRGEWRIEKVDGEVPLKTERPPSLIFGASSYAVWDGCNHSEGVQLVLARQLFTRGSGISTLASCAPDPLRSRIHAIVAGNPRIAKTEGGLALVAPAGMLRLTRQSSRGFGTSEQLGLRPPRTIVLLRGSATLRLGAGRFAVELQCGRIEGDWRGGQPARFSPDPIERTAPRCVGTPGSDAFRLGQFFTGNVHAVTGPNRDIVLLVNEDESIAGRNADRR